MHRVVISSRTCMSSEQRVIIRRPAMCGASVRHPRCTQCRQECHNRLESESIPVDCVKLSMS